MATFNFSGTNVTCHNSWDILFNSPAIQGLLSQIQQQVGSGFTPQPSYIFRVFQTDLSKCKVVILGQDPYPQSVATGRAFEVGGMISWNESGNASLRNILKLLHKNQLRRNRSLPPKNIKTVRNDILNKTFQILPPSQLFSSWENQGVLLLNTALTCPQGKVKNSSNFHAKHWKIFTEEVIKFIDIHHKNNVIWFLWGDNAKKFSSLIKNSNCKYCSNHPRLNSNKTDSFYYENHFNKATMINWY